MTTVYCVADVAQNAKADSFTEKLVANVIKNLEVTVTNIHIRFEDNATDPKNPFSVGFTLHRLSLQVMTYLSIGYEYCLLKVCMMTYILITSFIDCDS